MRNEPLELLKTKDEWIKLSLILSFIFLLNLSFLFYEYKKLKDEEVYPIKGYIENIYAKENYDVLKISTKDFTFFTSINKNHSLKKLAYIEANILTTKINFLSYLKGFYTKTININTDNIKHPKSFLFDKIKNQHTNENISEIYGALFLAINSNPFLRDIYANFALSHLIAISGFHLGVISLVIFFLCKLIYKPLQNKYFPYRNAKADILYITSIILFIYLYYIDFVPSFLRAFIMFIIGIYLLRANIKLISFTTLALTLLIILALFPKLLFSLSLFLSACGVFYIFLFIKYFKNLNKILAFFLFNIWIFLVINPIVHYFFGVASYAQIFSPLITILFSFFYPLSLFLHIIGFGDLFDKYLELWINMKVSSIEIYTNIYLFIFYIIISILAVFNKYAFYLLNSLLCLFNFYILLQI